MAIRQNTILDGLIIECDKVVKTFFSQAQTATRSTPGEDLQQELMVAERCQSTRLMRVNHAGEIAAQALYQGQALTAKLPEVRQAMDQAALEENDHLVWCQQRINELDGHTSIFNPLWYAGSFSIGAIAGKIGDKWSLGFVAETENQVVHHLNEHLETISVRDQKSRLILEQMKIDELHHGTIAVAAGGAELPKAVQWVMGVMSKVMTKSSYWI